MAKVVKKGVTNTQKSTRKKSVKKTPVKKKSVKKPIVKKKPTTKKVVKKPIKKSTRKPTTRPQKSYETLLLENFVALQKVMTNLSIKFSDMSQNISKVLFVFEEAAKDLAVSEKVMNDKFGKKVENLVEQNKSINKNLGLMDERVRRQGRIPTRVHPTQQRPQSTPQKSPEMRSKPTPKQETPQIKIPKSLPQI